jgi:hypothetical protein
MKTLSIIAAAALAVSSTAATAGNTLDAGTSDATIIIPEMADGGSMGSLGSGSGAVIAGVVGLALLGAAIASGSGT